MNIKKHLITKETEEKYHEELRYLIDVERPAVIEGIKEARAQGDLSENAEYDAEREKQARIEDRIKELEVILENFEIIENQSSTIVSIGSKVEFKRLDTNEKYVVQIVGKLETDPFQNKVSNVSPLSEALINSSEGDQRTVNGPRKYDILITKIF